jgi:hypothetical protein
MQKLTGKQYDTIYMAIVEHGCKVNYHADNRTINALVKAGYIENMGDVAYQLNHGFSYDVTPNGYRAALVYAATFTGALEVGIEALVAGYANHKREYTKD